MRQQHPKGKIALKTRRWISKKVNEWTILIRTIWGGITHRIPQRWDTCRAPQMCTGNTIRLSDRELNNNRVLPTQIRGQHQQHRKDKYYNARGRNQPWEHADPRRSPNGGLGGWARLRTWCRGQQCTNNLLVRAVQGWGHRVGLHLEEGHGQGRPRRRLDEDDIGEDMMGVGRQEQWGRIFDMRSPISLLYPAQLNKQMPNSHP